jgi:hypothetical protein
MLPQGVKKGRPDVESESIRVTVDRKSDQNPTVAGRERHRLGVGLVEASSHKRKGGSGDRSAEKTTSVHRLRFITAFRRHWVPPLPENGTLSPRRPAPGAHFAQSRSSKCQRVERRSQSSRAARSRARDRTRLLRGRRAPYGDHVIKVDSDRPHRPSPSWDMRISPQLKSVDVSRAEFPQSRLSAGRDFRPYLRSLGLR